MDKIKFQEMQNTRDRLLRLPQVLELLPISKSSFWNGLKSGRYPIETIHLGPRTTCWKESQILEIVRRGATGNE